MENSKEIGKEDKPANEKPNHSATSFPPESNYDSDTSDPNPNPSTRTPFTILAQVEADLALARTLQEQETAYMMLRMEGDGGYDNVSHNVGDVALNPSDFESDEAVAQALEDAEEREQAIRLIALAGLNDWGVVENGDHARFSQDAWQKVDPDELSYEELVALGEVAGTESRGLSADRITSLPSVTFKAHNMQDGNSTQCVICRLDYEDGDPLVVLSCKHTYHSECINRWLEINKIMIQTRNMITLVVPQSQWSVPVEIEIFSLRDNGR